MTTENQTRVMLEFMKSLPPDISQEHKVQAVSTFKKSVKYKRAQLKDACLGFLNPNNQSYK